MTETNHISSQVTKPDAGRRVGWGRPGLVIVVLAGAALMGWVSRNTWQRVAQLEEQFRGLRAESFYLGVRMHSGVRNLNDTLLRYRLQGNPSDYNRFIADSYDLKQWFESSRSNALSPLEQEFVSEVGAAYDRYMKDSRELLSAGRSFFQTKAGAFPGNYAAVQAQSEELLALCDRFMVKQRTAFDQLLTDSRMALGDFQRQLKLSVALLLMLAFTLVLYVYRGMIAPLRLRLSESQAIIQRQEKLAALGELAAGLAHEIRNPLTAIRFRLFSLKQSLPDSLADQEDVAVIKGEITRLEHILKDFLQFARPAEPEIVPVPAERLLNEVATLLRPQLEQAGVTFQVECPKPIWLQVDAQQMKQVLINLVQNAAQSVGEKGTVTLRAVPGAGPGRPSPAWASVEVIDNGPGIPPEVQKRLFDPFFTTRERGTGLGLAIAARIVEKHGGRLRYRTRQNEGTTFIVELPATKEHESKNPAG